ncbi:MAG: glycerate kinase [Bowdeniella nasicola]|nr:glycerate kinase [Bowdeniella nasicola]
MRALLVGAEPSTRHDFAFGWRSLQRSRHIDELPGGLAHPSAAQPLHLIGEDGHAAEQALPGSSELEVPLSDTSALAPALRQLVELSQQGSVIVGASPCGAHDGGAGAWHALTPRERQALAELAPRLTVAYVEETSLLGVGGRGLELAKTTQDFPGGTADATTVAQAAQAADRAITEFLTELSHTTGRLEIELARLARQPGTAMAGGVAFTLAALGARLSDGLSVVAEAAGWQDRIADADVVFVLSEENDANAVLSGLPVTVGGLAQQAGTACAVVGSGEKLPRRTLATIGITDLFDRGERTWYDVGRAMAATWCVG